VSEWQVLADLSFADLLMFCRSPDTRELTVVAQMRPYTAQTIYQEDLVGTTFAADERKAVTRAFDEAAIIRDGDPDWSSGVPVREEAVPVTFDGEVIGVVTREANLSMVRAPSQLELTYLQVANELCHMLAEGSFPYPGIEPERELAPRVGDGLMRIDLACCSSPVPEPTTQSARNGPGRCSKRRRTTSGPSREAPKPSSPSR
jgi:two-component system, sensor histidine kinase PdtaS